MLGRKVPKYSQRRQNLLQQWHMSFSLKMKGRHACNASSSPLTIAHILFVWRRIFRSYKFGSYKNIKWAFLSELPRILQGEIVIDDQLWYEDKLHSYVIPSRLCIPNISWKYVGLAVKHTGVSVGSALYQNMRTPKLYVILKEINTKGMIYKQTKKQNRLVYSMFMSPLPLFTA